MYYKGDGVIDSIMRHVHGESATRVYQRNAMVPFLWLCGIAPTALVAFAIKAPTYTLIALIMAGLPIVATLFVGVYFALCDPDRLQSEEYLLQKSSLATAIEAKGGVLSGAEALTLTNNPTPSPLSALGGESHE